MANIQRATVTLNTVKDSDANSATAVATTIGVLIGDTNGDAAINSADISQTNQNQVRPSTERTSGTTQTPMEDSTAPIFPWLRANRERHCRKLKW